jgi:hypothetical protein
VRDTFHHYSSPLTQLASRRSDGILNEMNRGKHILTGTAGVYYVMYRMAAEGLHASCTHGNAPNVDILVSAVDGSHSATIEVKTTENALRFKKEQGEMVPSFLDFPLGRRAAKLSSPNLIIAFVDLRVFSTDRVPTIYLYPSQVVARLCAEWVEKVPMVRFQPPLSRAEPFKENWDIIWRILDGVPADTPDLKFVRTRDDAGTYHWYPVPITDAGASQAVGYAGDASRVE